MQLEQQVVSLELAQRLKELGVKQESLYYWIDTRNGHHLFSPADVGGRAQAARSGIAAFTVAELGELLPPITAYTQYHNGWLLQCKTQRDVNPTGQRGRAQRVHTLIADTEADARAKMLIYLLENELFTATD